MQSHCVRFFVPTDQELIVPRDDDTVLHPPVGCCAVYIDHFKAGLRLPLFPFLFDILVYYRSTLSQLVPNVVCTVIAFQLFCDRKRVGCSVPLFRRFFLLKYTGFPGWYAFSSRRPSLKVKVPSKNADWKDKFLYFRLPEGSGVKSRWNLGRLSDRLDDSVSVPGFEILEGTGWRRVLLSSFSESTLVGAGLSQAPLDTSSDEGSSSEGGESRSPSGSWGIPFGLPFHYFPALCLANSGYVWYSGSCSLKTH